MELKKFFKNKLRPSAIINFLRYHRIAIGLVIFIIALLYGGFLLYSYAFRPLWFSQKDFKADKVYLNEDLYNEIWQDFSDRSVRLEEGMNKIYNDPFR